MTGRRTLDAFLPMDRRSALEAGDGALPEVPCGAVLFADLSGFTRLTESLVAEMGARRGVEELSIHINRIYEGLLAGAHGHRGSVVTFIGDALVVWFDAGDAEVPAAVRRAAAAAAEMQRFVAGCAAVETPKGATVKFAVRIGLAAGRARRMLVGEPGRGRFDVLAGATVDAAVAAEGAAEPGEIVAAAAFADELDAPVVEWRGGSSTVERFAVIEPGPAEAHDAHQPNGATYTRSDPGERGLSGVADWLPAPVVRRLAAGREFLGELRTSVPVFVQFGGIDFDDDPDAARKLDEFVGAVQDILEPLEGTLLQVIAGDKGSHLYIVFGAPIGHDDDEARALAAARAIVDRARALDYLDGVRIGVNSGRVFAGLYGAASRLSYAVIGDPVNLAARLMGRADDGQVLLTRRTVQRAGPGFETRVVGETRVKGRDETVEVLELLGRSTATEAVSAGALIGRQEELDRLLAAANDIAGETTAVMAIEGEAGIGKSRLLEEAARELEARGFTVLRGYADVVERRREYHAWRAALEALLDIGPRVDPQVRLSMVSAAVARASPSDVRLLPLLGPILDLPIEDSDLTRQMTGEMRANNATSLLIRLLQSAADRGPLAIVLEDAHWFDSPSWALLHATRRLVEPVLLIVSSRPHRASGAEFEAAEYASLLADRRSTRLELGALEPAEAARLAALRVGADALPDRVARLVGERSEGHPLFAVEIVLALRDAGALIVADGRAALAEGFEDREFDVPDTIEGVVTSRLDRLSPEAQMVAKVASVIGRTFDLSTLAGSMPPESGPLDVEQQVEVLVAKALVEPPAAPDVFIFAHSIIRDVTYETLLFAQRRALHRRVAESIEDEGGATQAERYAVLAHHWEYADEPPTAVDYLEKAGEHAVSAFANTEAIAFFGHADELVDRHGERLADDPSELRFRRARWRRLTGEARNGIGEFDRGHQDMRASLALLGRPEPRPVGMALRLFAELARQSSHRRLRPGLLARPGDARAALEAARVYRALVYPYYVSGNWLGGLYANWFMLNAVERYGGAEAGEGLLPHAKTNVAGAWLNILHNRKVGDRYLDEAREQARAENDLASLAWSYLVEGMVRVFNSSLDEARVALEEAHRLYEELGDPRRLNDTTYTLATWHFFRGDLDTSLAVSRELLRAGAARDDIEHQLLALGQEALCHVYAGRYAEALDAVERSRLASRPGESMAEQIFAAGVGTLAHARSGDFAAALEAANYADGLLDSVKISNLAIEGFSCLAEALLLAREAAVDAPPPDRALAALKKNANALSRIHRPRTWLLYGWRAALDDDRAKARRLLARCREAADEIGLPYEAARARLELAAGTELDAAQAAFVDMGMPWELERCRAAARHTRSMGATG